MTNFFFHNIKISHETLNIMSSFKLKGNSNHVSFTYQSELEFAFLVKHSNYINKNYTFHIQLHKEILLTEPLL